MGDRWVPIYCTKPRLVHGTLKKLGELVLIHDTLGSRCCSSAERQQGTQPAGSGVPTNLLSARPSGSRQEQEEKVVCSNRWPLR